MKIVKVKCGKCGEEWAPRKDAVPERCPKCRTRRWQMVVKVVVLLMLLQGVVAAVPTPRGLELEYGTLERARVVVRNETGEWQSVEVVGGYTEVKVVVPSRGRVTLNCLMPLSGVAVCEDKDKDGVYEFAGPMEWGRRMEWVVR